MATVAYSGHSRRLEAPITSFDGANTMPRRGLAHLVSKFESLDKATGAHRRQPSFPRQPLGLTPSKTMSSLSLFQDNRRYFEKGCQKQSEEFDSFKPPSPAAAAAASIRRTSSSAHKSQNVATPNRTGHNDRVAASVAEKRKFFESGESSARDAADGLCTPKAKTPRTAASSVLQAAKSDRKLPLSQSCEHIYSTPKTVPTSPTKYIFSISSLQNSRQSQREKPQGSSAHSVPASSFVVRVHRKSELRSSIREDERGSRKSEEAKQPPLRTTYVSSTGSPIKSPKRLDTAAVGTASRDASPVSSPKKAMNIASSPNSPSPTTREKKKESSRTITPTSVGSGESIIITKRSRADPSRAKGWSPQRIVTPQQPTMPQKISPIQNAEGHGTFVRSRKPENFRDALGFFEAMSNTGSVTSTCYTAPSGGRGSLKAMRWAEKQTSKREKLKGSLRKFSASWRLRRAASVGKTEAPLEYPAMWKIGSIDSTPRKRLHAEWCELSADHRRPLNSSKAGEISLFDPYLSSHAASSRGGERARGCMDILLQESSLHNNCAVGDSGYGAGDEATDCSRSPIQGCPATLKLPRHSSRRWFSRSSGTLVSQAHCQLEQPRPVHGIEIKRLISLCKLQGSMKRRGHTE